MDNNVGNFSLVLGGKRVVGEGDHNGITFTIHYNTEPVVLRMNDSMARGLAEALITLTSDVADVEETRRYTKVHGGTCFVEPYGVGGARLCLVLNGLGTSATSADAERELLVLNSLSAAAIGYSLEALVNGLLDFTEPTNRSRLRLVWEENGMTQERWDDCEMPAGWQLPEKRYFMVLNDGETYTGLHGCGIVEVDWDAAENPDTDLDATVRTAWARTARGEEFQRIAEALHYFW
jgi:hypothetical protein